MKNIFTLFFFLYSTLTFGQSNLGKRQKLVTRIPQTDKQLDIPTYEDIKDEKIPFVYWHLTKQKESQLSLSKLETNKIDTVFRIWITNPVGMKNQPHGLIEITKDSIGWNGRFIAMRVNFNYNKLSETITKYENFELKPSESSWEVIIDSLLHYKIHELPTDEKIQNYYKEENRYNNNAPTYSIEFSTADNYRFIQYSNIYRDIENFWQPEYINKILDILENEFGWDKKGRTYFKNN